MDKLAALVNGLPADSRTKARMTGNRGATEETLLALIADYLQTLVWMQSKDGAEGRNRPRSIIDIIYGEGTETDTDTFESPEAFLAERKRILSGGGEDT